MTRQSLRQQILDTALAYERMALRADASWASGSLAAALYRRWGERGEPTAALRRHSAWEPHTRAVLATGSLVRG